MNRNVCLFNLGERWELVRTLARAGRIDDIEPQIYIQNYGTLKRIANDNRPKPQHNRNLLNFWIGGPPGSGKSWEAHFTWPEHLIYKKNLTRWWDRYDNQPIVIIEDVDAYNVEFTRDFKIWMDVYVFSVEKKNLGEFPIRPKVLIVTSNYTIDQIWHKDEMSRVAINRRFESFWKTNRDVLVLDGCRDAVFDLCGVPRVPRPLDPLEPDVPMVIGDDWEALLADLD